MEQLNCLSLHDHVESCSEGDEEMTDDNYMMLGFLNSIEDIKKKVAEGHLFLSKVGGHPNWLVPLNNMNTST